MESTGAKNKIQISSITADLLVAGGKEQWIEPRKDAVKAKGKGLMKTFFLTFGERSKLEGDLRSNDGTNSTRESDREELNITIQPTESTRSDGLVDWMTGKNSNSEC
jgi:hypothetical protein